MSMYERNRNVCEHGISLEAICEECDAEAEFDNAADECAERVAVCPFDTIDWGTIEGGAA